jgi:hypothetical protein
MCIRCGAPNSFSLGRCCYCGAEIPERPEEKVLSEDLKESIADSLRAAFVKVLLTEIHMLRSEAESLRQQYPLTLHPSIPKKLAKIEQRIYALEQEIFNNESSP